MKWRPKLTKNFVTVYARLVSVKNTLAEKKDEYKSIIASPPIYGLQNRGAIAWISTDVVPCDPQD
ncbi:hypothetical protein HDF26_000435 [Pedobacter cryoconitis]|uniref:Uncharacterized protein n=1 Tax=Pedobacter cryoconitis TaxID=188932 RepID=A0A7W9E017_9SPHI|nr:hypothetical protein [Pedobacter cryoconitis]MBB6270008.1 hypothetical protein [Pedobacter cryoconitis]